MAHPSKPLPPSPHKTQTPGNFRNPLGVPTTPQSLIAIILLSRLETYMGEIDGKN